VTRHADARMRGYKRVQVEPHLSVTGACSAEWVPIRPKTDPAFMFALIHVLLIEHGLDELDVPFLRDRTIFALPGGTGRPLPARPASGKPLVWDDGDTESAVPFDTPAPCRLAGRQLPRPRRVSVDADEEVPRRATSRA
jgi:phenylacetyl-CoA:acceptor oxidoreductase